MVSYPLQCFSTWNVLLLHTCGHSICILSYRPNTDLRGLNAKRERSITVTFHCILPKLLWEWDEASSMHMRFEGPDLGHWKHNVGECKQGRCVPYYDK